MILLLQVPAGIYFWIANSKNVQKRIEKFYRKRSTVIYPPVDVEQIIKATSKLKKKEYYFVVSRLVGAKGLEDIAEAANKLNMNLIIAGEAHGFTDVEKNLNKIAGKNIELVGRVSDNKLFKLYGEAKGFIALAKDEDFGMTPVEAMAAGTPVIAYNGGGFRESVIDGKTGILINDTDVKTLAKAIKEADKIEWRRESLVTQARRFSKERFKKEITEYVNKHIKE
jgi:glycosyltransferase involved in cell wall biosynthesis